MKLIKNNYTDKKKKEAIKEVYSLPISNSAKIMYTSLILSKERRVTFKELCKLLNISMRTAHTSMEELECEFLVSRDRKELEPMMPIGVASTPSEIGELKESDLGKEYAVC